MQLTVGQEAPDFQTKDTNGTVVTLNDYQGKNLLISFARYAGCPFCNLTLIDLMKRYDNFVSRGLETIVFFQSDDDSIHKYVSAKKPPFPMIADPGKTVYNLYGIESSVKGVAKSLLKVPAITPGLLSGKLVQGKIEGDGFLMPAQFIVGPDKKLLKVHYGSDFLDKMPMFDIEEVIIRQSMTNSV